MKKNWGPSAQGPAASQTQEYHSPKGQGPGPSSGLNQSGPKLPLELQTKSHRQELLLCKLRSKSHFQFCLSDLGEGGDRDSSRPCFGPCSVGERTQASRTQSLYTGPLGYRPGSKSCSFVVLLFVLLLDTEQLAPALKPPPRPVCVLSCWAKGRGQNSSPINTSLALLA